MKKINLLKGIALSVSALMVMSLSGCDYISQFIGGLGGGGNNDNITGDDNNTKPELTISQTEVTLAVGDSVQLTATATDGSAVEWGVSPAGIVTVEDGLVTGIAEGEATVWAATESLMAVCNIKVNPAPIKPDDPPVEETLEISKKELSLEVEGYAPVIVTGSLTGATIKWASSSPAVAKVEQVDNNANLALITALAAGKATVTATVTFASGSTQSVSCKVTVSPKPSPSLPVGSEKPGYELVWYDEFEGTSLDTEKWNYQTGTKDKYADSPDYWGNGELQYYTQDAVTVSGGSLIITATKQQAGDRPYTSGRILTRDKASWTYGYFEAKMKTPTGNGMWPAFWMLPQPTNSAASSANKYGTWPLNGEIDIMEAKGRLGNVIDNTIHYGMTWPNNQCTTNAPEGYTLKSGTTESGWHTYAVEWTTNYISWYVDGVKSFEVTSDGWWTESSAVESAPFDQPFYILFNLAVGGGYDGGVAPEETFVSKSMYVDYVRVYKKL